MRRELTSDDLQNINQAIFAGDRIEATNIYISITECGLTEAQQFIGALTAELQAAHPDLFTHRRRKKHPFGIFNRLGKF